MYVFNTYYILTIIHSFNRNLRNLQDFLGTRITEIIQGSSWSLYSNGRDNTYKQAHSNNCCRILHKMLLCPEEESDVLCVKGNAEKLREALLRERDRETDRMGVGLLKWYLPLPHVLGYFLFCFSGFWSQSCNLTGK